MNWPSSKSSNRPALPKAMFPNTLDRCATREFYCLAMMQTGYITELATSGSSSLFKWCRIFTARVQRGLFVDFASWISDRSIMKWLWTCQKASFKYHGNLDLRSCKIIPVYESIIYHWIIHINNHIRVILRPRKLLSSDSRLIKFKPDTPLLN